MDTQKNEIYSVLLCIVLICAAMIEARSADIGSATDALPAPNMSAAITARQDAESTVGSLEKALAACEDNDTAFKIKYRMGVIYFRSNMMNESKTKFHQVAEDSECPELIRACSLNMVGQISRLQGRSKDALKAFEALLNLLEPRLFTKSKKDAKSASTRLWCSALFSKAEIYETEQDYAASIAQYSRLLESLSAQNDQEVFRKYAPLLNDRISRLYMRQGSLDKYMKVAEALIKNYPGYRRRPLVELESECVKLLRSTSPNTEFTSGGFTAPVRLIALMRKPKNRTLAQNICGKLDKLCEEQNNTYEDIVLRYHYAWLLEALGEKDKAAEVLARTLSGNSVPTQVDTHKKLIVETVRAYAGIQSAIIAAESAEYKKALRILADMQEHPDGSHVSTLTKAVAKNIEILRREVPRNEAQK